MSSFPVQNIVIMLDILSLLFPTSHRPHASSKRASAGSRKVSFRQQEGRAEKGAAGDSFHSESTMRRRTSSHSRSRSPAQPAAGSEDAENAGEETQEGQASAGAGGSRTAGIAGARPKSGSRDDDADDNNDSKYSHTMDSSNRSVRTTARPSPRPPPRHQEDSGYSDDDDSWSVQVEERTHAQGPAALRAAATVMGGGLGAGDDMAGGVAGVASVLAAAEHARSYMADSGLRDQRIEALINGLWDKMVSEGFSLAAPPSFLLWLSRCYLFLALSLSLSDLPINC